MAPNTAEVNEEAHAQLRAEYKKRRAEYKKLRCEHKEPRATFKELKKKLQEGQASNDSLRWILADQYAQAEAPHLTAKEAAARREEIFDKLAKEQQDKLKAEKGASELNDYLEKKKPGNEIALLLGEMTEDGEVTSADASAATAALGSEEPAMVGGDGDETEGKESV